MNKVIAFFFFFLAIVVLGIFIALGLVFAKEVNSNFVVNGKVTNLTPEIAIFKGKKILPQKSMLFSARGGDVLNFSIDNSNKKENIFLSKTITGKNDSLLYIFPSSVQNGSSITNVEIRNSSASDVDITADGIKISSLASGGNLNITVYEGEILGFGGKFIYAVPNANLNVILYSDSGVTGY